MPETVTYEWYKINNEHKQAFSFWGDWGYQGPTTMLTSQAPWQLVADYFRL